MPHQRFDVVFDSLQFDDRAREIYEQILSLSNLDVEPGPEDGQEGTGSIHVNTDFSGSSSVPAADIEEDDATVVASDGELRGALAQSAVHSVAGDDVASVYPDADEEEHPTLPPQPGTLASLRSNGAAPAPAYAARAVNGTSFSYPGGLPFPARPPRPDLDPGQRVTPAPRPER